MVKLKPIDQAVKNAKITNNANDFTAHSKRTLKWFGVNLYKSLQNTTVLTTDQFTNIRDGHLTFFSAQIAHIVSSNHQPFSIHRPCIGTFSLRILCKYYKFIYWCAMTREPLIKKMQNPTRNFMTSNDSTLQFDLRTIISERNDNKQHVRIILNTTELIDM